MNVFFDLDGTLSNSMEGITRSAQYALQKFGIHEPDLQKLTSYIGPPLKDSFMRFHGLTEAQADDAVTYYRERYAVTGILECHMYDGVREMLETLREGGCRTAVVTSKPLLYTEQILKTAGFDTLFDTVVGASMSERDTDKSHLVARALAELQAAPEQTWMVGDRKFDIEGARANGVHAIGVTYGFAPPGELAAAGADAVADTVAELTAFLLEQCKKEKGEIK